MCHLWIHLWADLHTVLHRRNLRQSIHHLEGISFGDLKGMCLQLQLFLEAHLSIILLGLKPYLHHFLQRLLFQMNLEQHHWSLWLINQTVMLIYYLMVDNRVMLQNMMLLLVSHPFFYRLQTQLQAITH